METASNAFFQLLLGLVLIPQFLNKRRKTFLIFRFVMIFKTKIQVILEPFSVEGGNHEHRHTVDKDGEDVS